MTENDSSTGNQKQSYNTKSTLIRVLLPVVVIIGAALAGLMFIQKQMGNMGHDTHGGAEIKVGATVPDFTLHRYKGEAVPYSQLGYKVTLINFWASWCEACMIELPSIVKLREHFHSQGFEVLAINVDENPDSVLPPIVSRFEMKFPMFLDTDQKLGNFFDVHAIPFTAVLDKNRKILMLETGDRDWFDSSIQEKMKDWLKQ